MTTPTTTPVPSTNPQDLLFNAEKLDELVNGTALSFVDRLGLNRRTVAGLMASLDLSVSTAEAVAAATLILQAAAREQIAEAVGNLTTEELNGLAGSAGDSMIGSGARSVKNRLDEQVSLRQQGGVLDGATNDATALLAANAIAQGRPILIDGVAHINSPVTITAPLVDVRRQIFTALSQVTIANGQAIRPEWFGSGFAGSVLRAHEAGPAAGGFKIAIPLGRTKAGSFAYGAGSITPVYAPKPSVTFDGEGLPDWSNNMDRLEGGAVVEGMLLAYAANCEARNFGLDSGKFFCDTYCGGTPQEGLIVTFPGDAFKAANTLRRGLRLHNIRALGYAPSAQVHGIIAGEGMTDIRLTGTIEAACSFHGIVFKGQNIQADSLKAYLNDGEGVIIKSDTQTTSRSKNIQIDKIMTTTAGPVGTTPHTAASGQGIGLMFNPQGGDISFVQIGSHTDVGHQAAVGLQYGENDPTTPDAPRTLDNVQIGSVTGDANTYATCNLAVPTARALRRFQIGMLMARNAPAGIYSNRGSPRVDTFHAVNCGVAAEISGDSGMSIGSTTAEGITDGVFRIIGSARPSLGPVVRGDTNTPMYTTTAGLFGTGTAAQLVNGWTQYAGSDKFSVWLSDDRVFLSGLVVPGTSNVLAQLPFWALPSRARRGIHATGRVGSVEYSVPLTIGADGVLVINELAGGTANCSTWLGLSGISYSLTDGA